MINALFPFLKPACSWRTMFSVAAEICLRMILLKTLLVRGSNVIPCQLLQSPRSPFFGSLTIVPVLQPYGVSSVSHICYKILHRILGVTTSSAFSTSGQIPSSPSAFPFFCDLIDSLTSVSVIRSRLTSISSSAYLGLLHSHHSSVL